MLMFKKTRKVPVGSRPGELVETDNAEPTTARTVRYDVSNLDEEPVEDFEALPTAADDSVLWLDVRGLRDLTSLRAIREHYGVHVLAMEDVVNVPQRPKAELYDEDEANRQLLFIFRRVSLTHNGELETEQMSFILGRSFILSFQENDSDALGAIRRRLHEARGLIRTAGADYLVYAMLDTIVDGYYPLLEQIAENLESLEDKLMKDPKPSVLRRLQRTKRTLLLLRRAVWPQREALSQVLREPDELINSQTRVYLRDTQDHLVQIADVIESYRDLVGELTNTYLSVVSNKMNEIMKVLTIMASIFIPLTFMAGIYGMNFEHMPELHVSYAYYVLLVVMVATAVGMLVFFRRRGWLGGGDEDDQEG